MPAVNTPKTAGTSRVSPALARQWLQSTTQGLHGFFAAQRAVLQLLPQAPAQRGTATPAPRPLPAAPLIAEPGRNPDGSLQARLLVDEAHPYFFDHPLDHVPGILMLGGLLELAEWNAPAGHWVKSIKLSFRRFCEKDRPVSLRMQPEAGGQWQGSVEQSGDVACRFSLSLAEGRAWPVAPAQSTHGRPSAELLHKHRPENILVSPLFDLADGYKACETHAPPPGHCLAAGADGRYGMLYLLETTRQFVMLIAHTVWNVPLGLPMNLLSIQLELDRPLGADETLTIAHRPTPLAEHSESAIVVVETRLSSGSQPIGRASIVAQALTVEAYAKQRHATATGERA